MQNLILLPGLLCDATAWQYQSHDLSDIANIIIPDLSQAATPEAMVDAVLSVAPPTFALAGHSMGGWVALEVMRHHASQVTKLCLVNTTAMPDSPQKAQARKEMLELAKANQYEPIIQRLITAFIFQEKYHAPVKVMLERNKHALINQETAMLMRDDCVCILDKISCPTLVLHAGEDKIFNMSDSKQLADNIRGARLEIVKNAGHMSIMEAAQETSRLMREWLIGVMPA